jgi:hypothetical protein
MRRAFIFGIGILIALGVWLCLAGTPGPWLDVLRQPLFSLWNSPRQLNFALVQVSENVGPVTAAGRRLLAPLGSIQPTHFYPLKGTSPGPKRR